MNFQSCVMCLTKLKITLLNHFDWKFMFCFCNIKIILHLQRAINSKTIYIEKCRNRQMDLAARLRQLLLIFRKKVPGAAAPGENAEIIFYV